MRSATTLAAIALIAALGAACGGSAPSEPASPAIENRGQEADPAPVVSATASEPPEVRSDRQTLDLALRLIDDMARASASAAGHCGVAAGAIESLVAANTEVWTELAAIAADEEREVVLIRGADRIDGAIGRLADGLGGCVTDRGIIRSLEAMTLTSP